MFSIRDVIINIIVSCTGSHERFLVHDRPSLEMAGSKLSVVFYVLFAFSDKFSALCGVYTVLKYYTGLSKGNRR